MRHITIKRKWFDLIKSRKKNAEVRMAIPQFRNIQPGEHVMLMCGRDRLEVHVYGRCVMFYNQLDAWGKFANARYGIPTHDFIRELIKIYSGKQGGIKCL